MTDISRKKYVEKKRVFEIIAFLIISSVLWGVSRLETRLFTLSETISANREFLATITYFALINVNVILILVLGFLIFRNIVKLVVERKSGVLGSKIRTKLVVSLVFFALAPTLLLFFVSMRFITTNFEDWFSDRVQTAIHQTREAGTAIYKQDQKRVASLATIAQQRVSVTVVKDKEGYPQYQINYKRLKGFDREYGIYGVKLYNADGVRLWSSSRGRGSQIPEVLDEFVLDALEDLMANARVFTTSAVLTENKQDIVKAVAPIMDPLTGVFVGVVVVEERFQTQILKSIENVLNDFSALRPGAQIIQISYLGLMAFMTMLITFSATWMGFYVARGITGPLQSLAEATREVALGNYSVRLNFKTDDETGQLVRSFNMMTQDLQEHRKLTEETQADLKKTNLELEQRRRYMEIVLKNIGAGVVSVSKDLKVTSFNSAAEQLLGINAEDVLGRSVEEGFGALYELFWEPIEKELSGVGVFHGQVEIGKEVEGVSLVVDATRVKDEWNVEVGSVLVFDDLREQSKAQRIAAWKEVARRIAHEIKNPITPIKLNAQRLQRKFKEKFDGEDKEVFDSCLASIIQQVDSLRDLVNEFSKFSRLPKLDLSKEDLSTLMKDVVDLFRMSYPNVNFRVDCDPRIGKLALDREQIKRVFVNLVTNAVASLVDGRPGEVTLSARLLEGLQVVRIEIKDNGRGIDAELRGKVLEPYFSTKEEGTGLGLPIVNQIVSEHGGYFRLVENEKVGTIAVIEIPYRVEV